ncbi:MAG: TolC family protein [Candidatus Glassbacteria bacterium]|nr:TolC family protein [Candidatus Glassbacteria bacterium]
MTISAHGRDVMSVSLAAALVFCMLVEPQLIGSLRGQRILELDLENSVEIAMGSSYRVKQLEMGIERTRYWLKSRRASLKSKIEMRLRAPEINSTSETKWNSTLQRDELVRSDTRRWQMDLSVSQPLILFGYPTNGYLSLNNKVYRYLQHEETDEIDYYNRFFIKFQQPFLLPNNLKNNIEDAELDLERNELDYITDRVRLVDDIADDYYDLFEVVSRRTIYENQIANLKLAEQIAIELSAADSSRAIEPAQARVELTNVGEQFSRTLSAIRQESARIKQRLQLEYEDSVFITPTFEIRRIYVDVNQAIEYGYNLRPSLRRLSINRRKNEIDLNNSKGWDAFHVNLEMTYGLENIDDQFGNIWNDYDDSYSVSLQAYVPLWDWGRRKARIDANEITLKKTELSIEENRTRIRSDIINAVANLDDYQRRAVNMQESVKMIQEITDFGMDQYSNGAISLQDLLQMITRQRETEMNHLDAYLGYRRSLLALMVQTYYDYENDISLIDKFRQQAS